MPEEDQPPQRIWLHDEQLSEWFDAVKSRRRNPSSSADSHESVPMVQNELTAQYR